jgi:hypothetical protein
VVCREVRPQLLAPEGAASPELVRHLQACPACSHLASALGRMDGMLRAAVITEVPAVVRARLAAIAPASDASHVDEALRSAVVVEAPAALQERLIALADVGTVARIDESLRLAVVVEPPAALQTRLLALAPADEGLGWLPSLWHMVRTRPAVLAGQFAALAVLAYALVQVAAWLGTLPVVFGDIPYALELLVLSPALDYLGQIEGIVQQLGLWLLVGAAGWLLAQGLSWQQREPAP